ncbi:MAG TPA: hypothetical protein VGS07_23150 [Thermoanaerobaculia bacterium]|jgi:hypothetical protein|nr:hypothetical protein [Thermoanaerobaculia bacterium]
MSEDRNAHLWTWITTLLCSLYIVWLAYQLGSWVGRYEKVLPELGVRLPGVTVFVTGLSKYRLFSVAGVLILGLVLKEFLVKRSQVRRAITFIVFMAVSWFRLFYLDAILKPLVQILDKIG